MRCTSDFEPSHEAHLIQLKDKIVFENPAKMSENSEYSEKLKQLCIEWIQKNGEIL